MNELTVVVSSCDKYEDILPGFLQCFKKYWNDCDCDILLTTESEPKNGAQLSFDKIVASGKNVSWTKRLANALNCVETPYILFILDDYFLNKPFTNKKIQFLLEIVKKHNAASLRLEPLPKPQKKIMGHYGEYKKGKAYRVSTQVAIWNTNYLKTLLNDMGDSDPWGFERQGSFLSEKYEQISLGMYRKEISYIEIICATRWISSGLHFCKEERVDIVASSRKKEPFSYLVYRKLRGVLFHINPTFWTKLRIKLQKKPANSR